MSEWTEEWPNDPGWYWFYGWPFADRSGGSEIHLVKVIRNSYGVTRVTNGHFLYPAEGGYGKWLPADLPEPPELTEGAEDES